MRALEPPTLVCTTFRIDMPAYPSRVPGSAAAADAAQVPTHCPETAGFAGSRGLRGELPRPPSSPPKPTNIAVEISTTTAARPASRA